MNTYNLYKSQSAFYWEMYITEHIFLVLTSEVREGMETYVRHNTMVTNTQKAVKNYKRLICKEI